MRLIRVITKKMEIKVLGTGCSKCKQLEKLTKEVVAEMGIEANVEKVEDIYGSKEWVHFFDTLINNPSCAMKQCQYKCGNREKDTYKK